ncbi:MAG: hypothetical protein AAB263_11240 [Planctomycetota bacterium]
MPTLPTYSVSRTPSDPTPLGRPVSRWRHLLAVVAGLLVGAAGIASAADVTIQPGVQHQTILGWGASSGWSVDISNTPIPRLKSQILDDAVNCLGLTRLRQNQCDVGHNQWEEFNDNGDPAVTAPWSAFGTAQHDIEMQQLYLPMKALIEANGEKFSIYISSSLKGMDSAWLLNSPGEFAEYATSLVQYLKTTHAIDVDHFVIQNEPTNGTPYATTAFHAAVIKELGPRFQQLGLPTKIQFCDGINAQSTWNYIAALQNDPEVWNHVGLLSYHHYPTDPYRSQIRDFARTKGIPTGQTENMNSNFDLLYDDLTLGGVSFWEVAFGFVAWGENPAKGAYRIHKELTSYSRHVEYWKLRQVTKYVRPGSVRVEAVSDDAAIRALAFTKNGKTTTVLANSSTTRSVTLRGLPAGSVGVSQTIGGTHQELGIRTVANGILTITVPASGVVTVYPYGGVNLAPTIMNAVSSARSLLLPATSTTLTATATDPEAAPLSYSWTVTSQPTGAAASFATPNAASTTANGLSRIGEYLFTVTVSDGSRTSSREIWLNVLNANQPPVMMGFEQRNPSGKLTLPTSSVELRGFAKDQEADPITYQWSTVSKPAGATITFAAPNATTCATSGMTVAGDYVFRLVASDGFHTISKDRTITVLPVNSAPVVSAASASPSGLTLPTSSTTLSSTTSDPNSDLLTHWWETQSAPAGAKPVFATPGQPTTTVSNLTIAGTYVFKIGAIDRTLITRKTVTVTVNPSGGTAPEIALTRGGTGVADGGTDTVTGLVAGTATVNTYTINNTGSAALTVGAPTISGLINCTATVSTIPAASVAAGASTTLGISVTPTAAGAWSCNVSTVTNDSDENPTNWTLGGIAASTPGSVPAPWIAQDFGTTGALGQSSWTASPDVWTISGAGTGIAGTADACQMAYRTVAGDFDFTAKLPYLPLSAATAQVGLILREKLTINSRVAFVGLLGSKQIAWAQRKEATAITQTVKTISVPPYVRLSRRGTLVSSWYSTDGTTWISAGTATTMALPNQIYLGLCVASGTTGTLMTATLEGVTLSVPTPNVPSTISINFQPSTSPTLVLNGVTWQPADGCVYGQRWSGLSYGCDGSTTATLNRNNALSPDERFDTCLNPALLTRTFSVGVPNGSYTVTVCVGDPNATSGTLAPEVQGVRVVTGTASAATPWFTGTVIVDVTNGKLVLSCGSGSTASRWAWMQITPVAAPAGNG